MTRGKLLFLITEDWFFRSHFLALAERAQAQGYEVAIAARLSGALKPEDVGGARLIDAPFVRGSLKPTDLWREAGFVRALIEREKPAIVHAIALKPIALTLLADWGKRPSGRVFAVTGRGYLAVARAPWTRFVSGRLARLLRNGLRAPSAVLAVENSADRHWAEAGSPLPDDRVVLMPGAGVDVSRFKPAPEPSPPIVVGVVSRLVWSKGIDLAVAAITQLREAGLEIELHIAGAPDPDNPEHVADEDIARWRIAPGVRLLGKVADVAGFWAAAHIACLPTRGGEGLPRALLEAAACGRAIVTTDVPGCRDFVVQEQTGLIVTTNDAVALAAALSRLAQDAETRSRMAAAGRARVEAAYTVRHATDAAARAWALAVRS